MYKIFDFLLDFFHIKNMFFLRIFGRSFRISASKKFLTSYHVSKLKFSSKFLENWPLHHELDLPRFLNISIMIEQSFLRKVIKRSRFGQFWKKSYGVLKISRVTSGLAKSSKHALQSYQSTGNCTMSSFLTILNLLNDLLDRNIVKMFPDVSKFFL